LPNIGPHGTRRSTLSDSSLKLDQSSDAAHPEHARLVPMAVATVIAAEDGGALTEWNRTSVRAVAVGHQITTLARERLGVLPWMDAKGGAVKLGRPLA
jgi:hypothetical protein